MAKKRWTISITGGTYRRLKAYCLSIDSSMSGLVQDLVTAHMDEANAPEVDAPASEADQHFTF